MRGQNGIVALTFCDVPIFHGIKDDPTRILRKPIPAKVVVLTFDDGCASHATYVGPLLKQLGFTRSFFFLSEFADVRNAKGEISQRLQRSLRLSSNGHEDRLGSSRPFQCRSPKQEPQPDGAGKQGWQPLTKTPAPIHHKHGTASVRRRAAKRGCAGKSRIRRWSSGGSAPWMAQCERRGTDCGYELLQII